MLADQILPSLSNALDSFTAQVGGALSLLPSSLCRSATMEGQGAIFSMLQFLPFMRVWRHRLEEQRSLVFAASDGGAVSSAGSALQVAQLAAKKGFVVAPLLWEVPDPRLASDLGEGLYSRGATPHGSPSGRCH